MPFPSSEETLAKREKPARPTRWNNLLEKNFYEEELRLWEEVSLHVHKTEQEKMEVSTS